MTLETRLRDAYEQLPVPDELGAFDRFRRRRARRAVVTGAGAVLVAAAILALPLSGVRSWPSAGGTVGPGTTALSPSSPGATGPPASPSIGKVQPPRHIAGFGIRPSGPTRAVAEAGPPGRVRTLVVQRGRNLEHPELGPVTCMTVLGLPVTPKNDEGGGCMLESHPGSPRFDLSHGYAAGPGSKANGLAGSVPHTAKRVRVLGRCGWTPVETTPADAGREFPASFFLLPPQPSGEPDTVLAFDAAGRQVSHQVLLPPGTDCQGAPRRP